MPSEGTAEMKRRRESLFVRLFQGDGPAAAALGTASIPLVEIIPTKQKKEKKETTIKDPPKHRNYSVVYQTSSKRFQPFQNQPPFKININR